MPGVYIISKIVNLQRNKMQVKLINTINHEIDASNIHSTSELLDHKVRIMKTNTGGKGKNLRSCIIAAYIG